ncbi:hypothetical protein QQ045_005109 [Rhodiola kirilowii]
MEMKGGGEVRRLNIIYFLSRMGRVEHPHLIRVHHVTPNGVYLRDVKRWLSELRGKDLAESFAWSYKRRYKAGYLWQDLLDDDLITPISDNEFVLKGSEIPSSEGDKKQDQISSWEEHDQRCCPHKSHDQSLSKTSSPSPEIIEHSIQFGSESSASMEYSLKQDEKSGHLITRNDTGEADSCYSSLISKQGNKKAGTSLMTVSRCMPPSSQQAVNESGRRSKSQSTASSILRNLTACCAVDTKDSVTIPTHRRIKKNDVGSELCKEDKLGGSARMSLSEAPSNHQQPQTARMSFDGVRDSRKKANNGEFSSLKRVPAAYKPVSNPPCSQCGKPFKPEKLHAHMKSCSRMKMLAKNAASGSGAKDKESSWRSTSPDREITDQSSLLCH